MLVGYLIHVAKNYPFRRSMKYWKFPGDSTFRSPASSFPSHSEKNRNAVTGSRKTECEKMSKQVTSWRIFLLSFDVLTAKFLFIAVPKTTFSTTR